MTTRICESATKRAAVAMLRSLGATEVVVRTALPTNNDQRGLGLDQYEVTEVRLSGALVRRTSDSPLRIEIVVAATEVKTKLGIVDEDATDTLRSLAGVAWGDRLLRITSVTPEFFGGCAYLYKISAEG